MATKILNTTIDKKIALKLDKLVKGRRQKKSYYVNKALTEYFKELEDYNIALSRKGGETISLKQAKKELCL